jgi:hypothetical protein
VAIRVGRHTRASDAGSGLVGPSGACLCTGLSQPLQGRFQRRSARLGVKRDRWQSSSHSQHNGGAVTNATNSITNMPNKDHPVPLRATQDHQSTTKRPVKFLVTPHALKLLETDHPI